MFKSLKLKIKFLFEKNHSNKIMSKPATQTEALTQTGNYLLYAKLDSAKILYNLAKAVNFKEVISFLLASYKCTNFSFSLFTHTHTHRQQYFVS